MVLFQARFCLRNHRLFFHAWDYGHQTMRDFGDKSLKASRVLHRSKTVNLDDGVRECLRRFLREIMPDSAGDDPVRVLS